MAETRRGGGALKSVLAERVAALNELRYQSSSGLEQLRAEVVLYERAMDRAARLLRIWVQLGFDERLVRLGEEQARQLADVINHVISALLEILVVEVGITVDTADRIRREQVPGVIREALAPLVEVPPGPGTSEGP